MPLAETCRDLLESAPEAMVVLDQSQRIVGANTRTERLFGHSWVELEGLEFSSLLAPESRKGCSNYLATFTGLPEHWMRGDIQGLRKQGGQFSLAIPSFAAGRIGGQPVLTGVLREIASTALANQQAESRAFEGRILLEAMLEAAPAMIMALDRDGSIDYINRVLPQYSRLEVIGSNWLKYVSPEHHVVVEGALATMVATGAAQSYETKITLPTGDVMWWASDIGPLRRNGEIVGAVLVSQDITEKKRTQAELLAGRRMAVLGTLAAGVAHEINTPIQFVGDSVRFLRDSGRDLLALIDTLQVLRKSALAGVPVTEAVAAAAQAEEDTDLPYLRENMPAAFERCIDGLGRVATIVRSLKEFAHPPGKDMAPVDLNHAIRSTLTIAGSEYKYVADLVTDLQALPPVVCYVSEISQVLLNLLVNAAHAIADVVKGSQNKGLITVASYQDGADAVITVRDTGGGIPEAIRGQIFDPFFTTKEVGRGTGQGLAIAQTTVAVQHKGSLTFETTLGTGTTFTIRLPIAGWSARDARP